MNGLHHLYHEFSGCRFVKPFFSLQQSIQIALCGVLDHYIKIVFIVEESIHGKDIFMFQVAMDLDLSSHLANYFLLKYGLFRKHFKGHYHFGLLLPDQVNTTILAPSQVSSNLKSVNIPIVGVKNHSFVVDDIMLDLFCEGLIVKHLLFWFFTYNSAALCWDLIFFRVFCIKFDTSLLDRVLL